MKASVQQKVARVEYFGSLWDRLLNLYLNREEFADISAARESEFLTLEGSIMEELATVAEFEEGRFALVDEVTSVINEAVSLRQLKNQSEFQVRRRKERGRQVSGLISSVRRFVSEADAGEKRREKELEAKLARPFWDPEKGKFGQILGRIVAFPARFFSAIRVAGEARKANSFLLTLLCLVSVVCVIIVAAFNAGVARAISYNFALESGILTSDQGGIAKFVILLIVGVGIVVVSLAGAIVAAILAHVLAVLMHLGFKIAGGKGDVIASHKVVAFGLAPLLLVVVLPIIGYATRDRAAPVLALGVFSGAMVCYIAVLHIIGFKKVHNGPVAAGAVGWVIGMVLFAVVVLAALWIWHASVNALPPYSGEYLYVTSKEAPMFRVNRVARTLAKGEILKLLGERGKFYKVEYGKEEGVVKKSDAELREGSVWSLPLFLVESSAARAETLIDQLSRKIEKEAK